MITSHLDFRKERIKLGQGRSLWIDENGNLRGEGFPSEVCADLAPMGWWIDYASPDLETWVLVVGTYGQRVFRCQFDTAVVEPVLVLNRKEGDDHGFYRLRFVEAGNCLLLVYEHGVACFDQGGRPRWSARHEHFDDLFLDVQDGVVRFENEHRGTWGYRLEDGRIVELGLTGPLDGVEVVTQDFA